MARVRNHVVARPRNTRMTDRELDHKHQIVETDTHTVPAPETDAMQAQTTRFVTQGPVPPPLHGFSTPGPTASTLAYSSAGYAAAPQQPVAAPQAGSQQSTSASTAPSSQQTIQMPEEYVGKPPDVEMGEDYVGQPVEGGDYVNHGPVCERPAAAGACYLTPTQRRGMIEQINRYVPLAANNYQTALQNARIDELLKKAPQLGLVAELLIGALGLVSGTLLNGVMAKALNSLAERAIAKGTMKATDLTGIVAAQSGHVRNIIAEAIGISKGRAKLHFAGHTPQSQVKVAFLTKLQNEVSPVVNSIAEGVLNTGDDAAIVLTRHMLDPVVFSVEACSAHVNGMLTKLAEQHIDDIGPIDSGAVHDVGTTEIVRLQSWGKQRLALMRFIETKKLGRIQGDDLYTSASSQFVNWIDDDFGDFATSVQENRHGSMKTIDVSLGHRFGTEVQTWVERTTKGAAR